CTTAYLHSPTQTKDVMMNEDLVVQVTNKLIPEQAVSRQSIATVLSEHGIPIKIAKNGDLFFGDPKWVVIYIDVDTANRLIRFSTAFSKYPEDGVADHLNLLNSCGLFTFFRTTKALRAVYYLPHLGGLNCALLVELIQRLESWVIVQLFQRFKEPK